MPSTAGKRHSPSPQGWQWKKSVYFKGNASYMVCVLIAKLVIKAAARIAEHSVSSKYFVHIN